MSDVLQDINEQLVIPPASELRKLILEKVMLFPRETLPGEMPSSENDGPQEIDMTPPAELQVDMTSAAPPSPESSISSGKSSYDSGVETSPSGSSSGDIIDMGTGRRGLKKQLRHVEAYSDSDTVGSSVAPKNKKRKLSSPTRSDLDGALCDQSAKRKLIHGSSAGMEVREMLSPVPAQHDLPSGTDVSPNPFLSDVPTVPTPMHSLEPSNELLAKRKAVPETPKSNVAPEATIPARKKLKIAMPHHDYDDYPTLSAGCSASSSVIHPGNEVEQLQNEGHFPGESSEAELPALVSEREVPNPSPVTNSDNNGSNCQSIKQTVIPETLKLIEHTPETISISSSESSDDEDDSSLVMDSSPPRAADSSSSSGLLLGVGDELSFGFIEIQGIKYSLNSQASGAEPTRMDMTSTRGAGVSTGTSNQNGNDVNQPTQQTVPIISEDSNVTFVENESLSATIIIEDPNEASSTTMTNSPTKLLSLADLMMAERQKKLEAESSNETEEMSRDSQTAEMNKLRKLVEVVQSSTYVFKDHLQSRRYKCKLCPRSYTQQSNAHFHIRTVHWKLNLFKCQQCSKSFPRKHHLDSHLLVHVGSNPFKCPRCTAAFRQLCNLKSHCKIHHPDLPLP